MTSKLALRAIALGYLGLLIAGPVGILIWQTFAGGLGPVWEALTRPTFLHALKLTLIIAAIAVPLNTIFGILFALTIVRREFRGKQILTALLDLPLGVSPVVVGLALTIVYGRRGEFGSWLADHGIRVIFALPGMVLATIFVCIPFVAREVIPVLREIGTEQEQAARTLGASDWQIFRLVTFPAIRVGVAFGVVLTTARALGEYGAVAIVSGKLSGRTETLTVHVEDRFLNFDMTGAYTASLVLASLALLTLFLMQRLKPRGSH
ncbi:MAG TPA: sulfate ABC transporter permease subunit [Thermomicrobiales bacterium]|nr:sulfate ABC transporter permease subunit [Thermomicrobiales bacterium]